MRLKVLLLGVLLVLSACSGKVYERAYVASGEGNQENELREDEQFTITDDFNVVIKLNEHEEVVKVMARFVDPNGDVMEEISTEAGSSVGTLVLGIDYEARTDTTNQWIVGRYKVDIFVDDEKVDTVFFRVD